MLSFLWMTQPNHICSQNMHNKSIHMRSSSTYRFGQRCHVRLCFVETDWLNCKRVHKYTKKHWRNWVIVRDHEHTRWELEAMPQFLHSSISNTWIQLYEMVQKWMCNLPSNEKGKGRRPCWRKPFWETCVFLFQRGVASGGSHVQKSCLFVCASRKWCLWVENDYPPWNVRHAIAKLSMPLGAHRLLRTNI